MRLAFKESRGFTERIVEFLDDVSYGRFQKDLAENPEVGSVIPGCGGLRKIRLGDPSRGKGKRGGGRVLYLYIPEVDLIFFVAMYGKNEKDDLSSDEKKILRGFAEDARREFLSSDPR